MHHIAILAAAIFMLTPGMDAAQAQTYDDTYQCRCDGPILPFTGNLGPYCTHSSASGPYKRGERLELPAWQVPGWVGEPQQAPGVAYYSSKSGWYCRPK